MQASAVQIIRLEAMRVASAYGYGNNPEEIAWGKMAAWAQSKGFLADSTGHPIFGFNNPYPMTGMSRYGYEFWMKVGTEVEPEGDIRINEFLGGTYAVTRCEVRGHPETRVPEAWKTLADWCRQRGRSLGPHHALERFLGSPEDLDSLVLDLFCPIIP
jgi:DNA gyrase inhibitor GyrI